MLVILKTDLHLNELSLDERSEIEKKMKRVLNSFSPSRTVHEVRLVELEPHEIGKVGGLVHLVPGMDEAKPSDEEIEWFASQADRALDVAYGEVMDDALDKHTQELGKQLRHIRNMAKFRREELAQTNATNGRFRNVWGSDVDEIQSTLGRLLARCEDLLVQMKQA